jgi:hypothetical protein
MYINHLTLLTGHLARTPRSDVAPEIIKLLSDWLVTTLDSGRTHPLPVPSVSHFGIQTLTKNGLLQVTVFGPSGQHKQGKPHNGPVMPLVTFGVAGDSLQGKELWEALTAKFETKLGLIQPDAPWCIVAIHPTVIAYPSALAWLGDFERCIAWAWLTRT